jgi:V/A-type H+-transporting ATPase subunit I
MTSTSIICVKKDVELILETLNSFGEFHIEPSIQEDASIAEYNRNIQKIEERLSEVDILTKQLVQEKTSFLDIFKTKQQIKVNVTADNWKTLLENTSQEILTLKKEIDNLEATLASLQEKNAELKHIEKMLLNMESMDADLETIGDLKLIYVAFASMPLKNIEPFETALATLPVFINQCHLCQDEYFICLVTAIKHKDEVERILRTYHAEIFRMPEGLPQDVGKATKQIETQNKINNETIELLNDKLKKIGEENKDRLACLKENSENISALLKAEKKILQSGRLATLKGFVPEKKYKELTEKIDEMTGGKAIVLQNEAEVEAPPTKIIHNRFIKPFEEITRLYGLPKYDEVDPTPFLAITFPILFGLMFGDIGHGLALLIGGAIVGSLIKGNQGIKNVCWIMAACGAAAMVAGLLFGEFFGQTEVLGFKFTPLWFSPFHGEGVFSFLIFALCVGIVQIVSGIVIEIANFAVKKNYADALLTALPKIAFYLGGVYLIAVYQLNFGAWLSGPILLPLIPFIIMVAGKPLFLMVTKPKLQQLGGPHAQHAGEHSEQDTFVGRLFEGGDLLTRLLSNTISYSRILALLMAHWALLLVTYTVADLVVPIGGIVLSMIVIIFGNIAVLALEGLIVFIHTLRLHFYEWFSKFYGGTGTEFSPFKQKFDHTTVDIKRKKA